MGFFRQVHTVITLSMDDLAPTVTEHVCIANPVSVRIDAVPFLYINQDIPRRELLLLLFRDAVPWPTPVVPGLVYPDFVLLRPQ